jgi:hypothetical protein
MRADKGDKGPIFIDRKLLLLEAPLDHRVCSEIRSVDGRRWRE